MQWTLQGLYDGALFQTRVPLVIDYDEDGALDLITHETNFYNPSFPDDVGKLFARRGVGDGTFEAPIDLLRVAAMPQAADVDGDGHLDLIVVDEVSRINVLPGTGTWFGAPIAYDSDYPAVSLIAGNFDADAAVELVAVNDFGGIVVYDNIAGTFVETHRAPLDFPTGAAVADFDNDGFYDVVVGSRFDQTVSVFFRNADGTFASPLTLPAGNWPKRAVVGDVDGDGNMDFAFSHWRTGAVHVYRYAGSRQFTRTIVETRPADRRETVNYGGDELVLNDLDDDGDLDLIASSVNGRFVTTLAGVGDGTFLTPSQTPALSPRYMASVAVADLDGDGKDEVIAGAHREVLIFSSSCATFVGAYAKSRTISLGQRARFEIRVAGFGTATPAERGSVSIDGVSVEVDANGRAFLELPDLELGSYVFTAHFSGNGTVPAGTAEGVPINVTSVTTQTALLGAEVPPPTYGTGWWVNARVDVSTGESLTTEYVLEVDGVPMAPRATWAGGVTLYLAPGPHTVRAVFEGGYSYPPSESELRSVTILKATPSIAHSGGFAVREGSGHVIRTTISGAIAPPSPPTGAVQYFEGTTLLTSVPVINGVATATLPVLPRGSHHLRAIYSGDANYEPAAGDFALQVLPNQPLVMEARGLPAAIQIAYVLPPDTSRWYLFARIAGTTEWHRAEVNPATGLLVTAPPRGVVYEYMIQAQLLSGSMLSSIDSAMLFTDDLLAIGTAFKRVHFVELRQAVNQQRALAGLPPFEFDASFASSPIVRASHINGLRTALNQARSALGMPPATFPTAVAGSTKILASDVQQLREHAR
ncbi:MAG TPA: FG-GAP-like repeat-containing protein [Thermoanaerobaculia bacterium]|jgi:hypothetical protein|nr:FG-GAP-like repeat-containing protein [Thermoanaerobaculia bacterium]